jgi:hypothetical protein
MRKPNAGIFFLPLVLAAPWANAAVTIPHHGGASDPTAVSPLSSPAGKNRPASFSTKLNPMDTHIDRTAGIRPKTFGTTGCASVDCIG